MKITRDKILEELNSNKEVNFKQICKALKASSKKRKEKVSKLVSKMERAGILLKTGNNYKTVVKKSNKEPIKNSRIGLHASNDWLRIAEKHSIDIEFPRQVIKEARKLQGSDATEIKKRRKAEGWIVTIDSESAKDLDDAVSVEKVGGKYVLGVHIADVSWYVDRNHALDKEAYHRSTSVYLVDKVIPMFPTELSNDLCSLNADRDKLCFSVFITLSKKGKVLGVSFEKTTVRVTRRLSYKEVATVLKGKDDVDKKNIFLLKELSDILAKKRYKEGSLVFEPSEVKIKVDKNSEPISIAVPVRLDSEKIVEEFMLMANKQVAIFLRKQGDLLYRIHDDPDPEKLQKFYDYAASIGIKIRPPKEVDTIALQKMIDKINEKPEASVLNTMLVRSLQKAVYSTSKIGHFGLAFEDYTHFTSPIRRYPDLVIHRLLAASLHNKKCYCKKELELIAEQTTKREQRAIDAERDLVSIKGARFMKQFVGKPLVGKITSIMEWGMFINVQPYGVDGLLHVREMTDDRYSIDPHGYAMVGERRGKEYSVGELLKISVKKVNVVKGFVDLALL